MRFRSMSISPSNHFASGRKHFMNILPTYFQLSLGVLTFNQSLSALTQRDLSIWTLFPQLFHHLPLHCDRILIPAWSDYSDPTCTDKLCTFSLIWRSYKAPLTSQSWTHCPRNINFLPPAPMTRMHTSFCISIEVFLSLSLVRLEILSIMAFAFGSC